MTTRTALVTGPVTAGLLVGVVAGVLAACAPAGGSGEASSPPAAEAEAPSTAAPTTAAPEPVPTPVPTVLTTPVVAPLPACAYVDEPTRYGQVQDWARTMLDTNLMLPADYRPDDLVPVATAGVAGWGEVRALMIEDLRAMDTDSRAAGAAFAVRSAFRDYATQRDNFERWVATIGEAGALGESARPGHSEHQLGTALDLRSADSVVPAWEYPDWGLTATGAWLRENSWRYGFVLSYPAGQSAVTCYEYESWHFRYVGRESAGQMHASGLTLREHLWRTSESQP